MKVTVETGLAAVSLCAAPPMCVRSETRQAASLRNGFFLRQESLDKPRIEIASAEVRVRQYPPVQRNRRVDSFHDKHSQGTAHARDGFAAILAADHQLGNQRDRKSVV